MAVAPIFDVVLYGYRNDVARARVLEYLDGLPLAQCGPTRVDQLTGLPQRLFAALPREQAEQLRGELEALGAQVTLLDAAHGEAHAAREPASVPAVPPAAPASSIRRETLMLVLALAGAVIVWQLTQPAPPRAVPPILPATQQQDIRPEAVPLEKPEAARLNEEAIGLSASAEFRAAVERLEAGLRLAPGHPVLTRNLQTVLFNWGVADLGAGRLDAAAEHLQAAADLGERADVLRALGVTHLREADYTEATANLQRALQMAPTDPNTMLALAEAYLRQDKRPEALDLLHRAKEAGARGPELDKRMQQLGREVDAEWGFVQLESRHFRVSFADDDDRGAVRLVLATLEDAYDDVGRMFDYYPDDPTPVVLYTQQDFHTITQTPDWAGAAFDGRIKLPVRGLTADDANLPRIACHEYAHSLVARLSGGRAPTWLNEGLAVWAEEAEDGEREAWAKGKIAGQELFTLEQLRGSFTHLPASSAEVAYAESYLAVRALIDRYGGRSIPTLLRAVEHHPNMNDAFAAVYPDDLARFQDRFLHRLGG